MVLLDRVAAPAIRKLCLATGLERMDARAMGEKRFTVVVIYGIWLVQYMISR